MPYTAEEATMRSRRWKTALASIALLGLAASTLDADDVRAQEVIDLYEGQESADEGVSESSADDRGDSDASSGPVIEQSGATGGGAASGGAIRLPFDRKGSAILVEAAINGTDVYFIFDTGASITSLTPAVAKKAGIYPKKSYPVGRVNTANGPTSTRYGLVDNLELGGRSHFGVTYSLCKGCPSGTHNGRPIAGLLGLNLLRRYRTSIDDAQGHIVMNPNTHYSNRWTDIRPWLKMKMAGRKGVQRGGELRIQVRMKVHNRAPRAIEDLELELTCLDREGERSTYRADAIGVGARKKSVATFLTKFGSCARVNWEVVSARW
jgi:hypothetical protein